MVVMILVPLLFTGRSDRQIDRQTDRQTDRQIDRQRKKDANLGDEGEERMS